MLGWRAVAAALALAAYALLSHLLMVAAAAAPWAIVVLLAPLLLALAALALKQRHLPSLAACAVAAVVLAAYVGLSDSGPRVEHLYVLQHAGIHAALGLAFGATLRRGTTPLVSVVAGRVHGTLSPALARYTRRLTGLWTAYFWAMVALSLGLYTWAPWWLWSAFANLLTPVAAVALFVGEYLLRYRLHPEFERATLAQTLAAYRGTPLIEGRRP